MKTISVLIPTLNASPWLSKQLAALHAQTVKISEIVIIDSQSDDNTCELASADPLCRVVSIIKKDYDHGATRDIAVRSCNTEYIWFLTQDAIPADENCLEELLNAIQNEDIACVYGRQIVSKNATRIEQLNRLVNYPVQGFVRSARDIPSLQIRAFYLSNTCCLYKRDIYIRCGGFQHNLPTNEDMLIAASFLHQGYCTAYCAKARVWHTHHMTLKQWYRRSFDTGAFMAIFSNELDDVKAYGMGKKYVFTIIRQLIREGRVLSVLYFILICAARFLGDYDGHRYAKLSAQSILRRTQNPVFWQRYLHDSHSA